MFNFLKRRIDLDNKPNKNNSNLDDFSINSVYLNTFRKRKKKSNHKNSTYGVDSLGAEESGRSRSSVGKSKAGVADTAVDIAKSVDLIAAPAGQINDSKAYQGDSEQSSDDTAENAVLNKHKSPDNSIYRVIAATTMVACSQLIPVMYKSIAESAQDKDKSAEKSVESDAAKDENLTTLEIDVFKFLYSLKQRWKSLLMITRNALCDHKRCICGYDSSKYKRYKCFSENG